MNINISKIYTVCVYLFIYLYVHKSTQYTNIMSTKTFILDAINRFTALFTTAIHKVVLWSFWVDCPFKTTYFITNSFVDPKS